MPGKNPKLVRSKTPDQSSGMSHINAKDTNSNNNNSSKINDDDTSSISSISTAENQDLNSVRSCSPLESIRNKLSTHVPTLTKTTLSQAGSAPNPPLNNADLSQHSQTKTAIG